MEKDKLSKFIFYIPVFYLVVSIFLSLKDTISRQDSFFENTTFFDNIKLELKMVGHYLSLYRIYIAPFVLILIVYAIYKDNDRTRNFIISALWLNLGIIFLSYVFSSIVVYASPL